MAKLPTQAAWLKTQHPTAAARLKECLEGRFVINRVDLLQALPRCLGTTDIIDNSHSGIWTRTRRVSRWKHASILSV